jgi:glycosyltransferase involved in cell wall biosynthesis
MRVDLSIIICTFRRLELLKEAVTSLLDQQLGPKTSLEIIVVDNSPERGAEAFARNLKPAAPIFVSYLSEKEPNVSLARNTGLRAAMGEFIAFVDDDNRAPPYWAETILAEFRESAADIIFGDVYPEFDASTTEEERRALAPWFTRRIEGPSGVALVTPRRKSLPVRTCNAAIRRSTCLRSLEDMFDPAFGRSGGEDTDFFARLVRRGLKLTVSRKACMSEFIPKARSDCRFVLRREYLGGRNFARVRVKHSQFRLLTTLDLAGRGLLQVVYYASALLLSGGRSMAARVRIAQASGKITWMFGDPSYW